jgi:predicted RNA binding protein YcfA (HicA-like mRNA interferase family)
MQDVETLLARFGFRLARVSGSHHIFEFEDNKRSRQIVVPLHGRKVKRLYIRKVVELLDELFPEDDPDSTDSSEDVDNEDAQENNDG